jgi:dihydrofolate reductase
MNAARKLVVSRTLTDVDDWQHSSLLEGELVEQIAGRRASEDLIVVGSASVAHALIAHDLVDEFRLIVFPLVIGTGTRLFEDGARADLRLVSSEPAGAAMRLVYRRA